MELTWQNPPEQKRHRPRKYDDIVETLMTRPGMWALVSENDTTRRVFVALRNVQGIEVLTRINDGGRIDTYARWVDHTTLGNCKHCGRHGKVNADNLCRVHAPLERGIA